MTSFGEIPTTFITTLMTNLRVFSLQIGLEVGTIQKVSLLLYSLPRFSNMILFMRWISRKWMIYQLFVNDQFLGIFCFEIALTKTIKLFDLWSSGCTPNAIIDYYFFNILEKGKSLSLLSPSNFNG